MGGVSRQRRARRQHPRQGDDNCTGSTNQQWNVNSDGGIVEVESGKCLDAVGRGTANGTLLEIWTCNGGGNQKCSRS